MAEPHAEVKASTVATGVLRRAVTALFCRISNTACFGRARVGLMQQQTASFDDEMIDVGDGERYHGGSLLVEIAARRVVGEPLDGGIDPVADGVEVADRPRSLHGCDHFVHPG